MVRKLRHHERRLLKKVDFISWPVDNHVHEVKIMKKYFVQKQDDYNKYKALSREVRDVAKKIKEMEQDDPVRLDCSAQLLERLHMLGLIPTKLDLELCNAVTASTFCRRRLPVILVRLKMAENIKMATKLVQQGHVRVGTDVIKEPSYLVSRNLEDFVTWVDTSAIRRHILEYNEMRDDFEFLG